MAQCIAYWINFLNIYSFTYQKTLLRTLLLLFLKIVESLQCILKGKNITSEDPFVRVLRKRCSKNMQQIYRRTSMPKCNFNKVTKQLYWNHYSAWVFSCKFGVYFQNLFSREQLWRAASATWTKKKIRPRWQLDLFIGNQGIRLFNANVHLRAQICKTSKFKIFSTSIFPASLKHLSKWRYFSQTRNKISYFNIFFLVSSKGLIPISIFYLQFL